MFQFSTKIDTNEKKIDEILTRSISQVFPSKEALKKELMSGRRLRIYIGADATGADLHLGHATNFILLEKLRQLGHEVIVLFGDFTAQIGDPTDKSAARVRLTKKEVEANLQTWKKQIGKIVSFRGTNPVRIRKNSGWLAKLSFEEIIEISSNFTVQQMIERDMFQQRLTEGRPIHLHEFLYPLMQGYDSVHLDVDVEIGGNDQTFNMLAGRILQRKIRRKEKFVISTTLLENPKTGKKLMSKSQGDYISLQDSPADMFGKTMALSDYVIIPMFIDTTHKSLADIENIKQRIATGSLNPMEAKKQLAEEIVTMYHGQAAAKNARENFEKTFSRGEVPEETTEISVDQETNLVDVVMHNKLVDSKSEWRRLVEQGGVLMVEENKKITDHTHRITRPGTYRIGKRRFIKIILKIKK